MTRKLLLGDKILLTSLETKVEKNKQAMAYDPSKKKGAQKKTKEKLNNFSAAIVKKPSTEKETIKWVNLIGIPDEKLFGPAFLYEKEEICAEKKVISTNPIRINPRSDSSSEADNEDEDSDMHEEEDKALNGYEDEKCKRTYTPKIHSS